MCSETARVVGVAASASVRVTAWRAAAAVMAAMLRSARTSWAPAAVRSDSESVKLLKVVSDPDSSRANIEPVQVSPTLAAMAVVVSKDTMLLLLVLPAAVPANCRSTYGRPASVPRPISVAATPLLVPKPQLVALLAPPSARALRMPLPRWPPSNRRRAVPVQRGSSARCSCQVVPSGPSAVARVLTCARARFSAWSVYCGARALRRLPRMAASSTGTGRAPQGMVSS